LVAGSYDHRVYFFSREIVNSHPTLDSGGVSPTSGTTDDNFVYEVIYTDNDGDAPSYVRVYIDGEPKDMTPVSFTYKDGALYRYVSTLSAGEHTYYFEASDGIDAVRLPAYGNYRGPSVSVTETAPGDLIIFVFPAIVAIVLAVSAVLIVKKR
jgi:hypothetical protein